MELRVLPDIETQGDSGEKSPMWPHDRWHGRDCTRFTKGRQLDSKNAQPGSLGSDFALLGINFWNEIGKHHAKNDDRKNELVILNNWRNAVAHQSFEEVSPGKAPNLALERVRRWRSVCGSLAGSFDEVMRGHLESLIGSTPWPR